MQTRLTQLLLHYICGNNTDLLFTLQHDYSMVFYIQKLVNAVLPKAVEMEKGGAPTQLIEDHCLLTMVKQIRPSIFLYTLSVLEQEFLQDCQKLVKDGVLSSEVVKMAIGSTDIFEAFGFDEGNEHVDKLRHALIAKIHSHLN